MKILILTLVMAGCVTNKKKKNPEEPAKGPSPAKANVSESFHLIKAE